MTAGLRRFDVHFGSSRVTVNISDSIPLPSPPPLHLRRASPRPAGPTQAPYFARSMTSTVVVVLAVLLFELVVAAFINTLIRCLVRRRRQQPVDDHNDTEKGLHKSVIEALPMVAYGIESSRALLDSVGGKECVVCLSEFVDGEKVRLLPVCKHGFHPLCIEKWLLTRTTCPVCRCSVLPTKSYSESDTHPSSIPSMVGNSARFEGGRISSLNMETVEPSAQSTSVATADLAGTAECASTSASDPKRILGFMFSTEAMANILNGVGPRISVVRNRSPV